MRFLLTLNGYDRTRIAANGNEALAMLRADFHPCVILLDLVMPEMDGTHFLDAKAADPALAATPVIAMSGAVNDHPALAHAAAFLRKPFDLDQFLALVSQHCAQGRA